MEKHNTTYLVPVDFTTASESATKFAIELAENSKADIVLLHVIKSAKDKRQAEMEMAAFVEKHAAQYDLLQTRVIEGSLADEIHGAAKILQADMIVMGTHCITGIGKVFKSHAFKIVEHVSIPLIIVQKETSFKAIKKIVLTIDLERESVQIVRMAANISKLFNSEIILVAKEQSASSDRQRRNINLQICHKVLEEKDINHKIVLLEGKDFVADIFKLCKEERADLLAATYYQQHVHLFTESFLETLAYNELHIPLLTMEEESSQAGGFRAMGG